MQWLLWEVEVLLRLTLEADLADTAFTCLIKSRLSDPAVDKIAYDGDLDSWQYGSINNALVRRLGEALTSGFKLAYSAPCLHGNPVAKKITTLKIINSAHAGLKPSSFDQYRTPHWPAEADHQRNKSEEVKAANVQNIKEDDKTSLSTVGSPGDLKRDSTGESLLRVKTKSSTGPAPIDERHEQHAAIVINEVVPLPEQHQIPEFSIQYELQLEGIRLDSIHDVINRASDVCVTDDDNWPTIIITTTPSWIKIILYILLFPAVT
ncbi:hypothetical protein HF086_001652 [Spodoptera exigua]|uniref:Uncharacterized protein n=1 Tax=Spodoptera exigua TaxID=7107 RepID=A0A922MN37_SPOEX|nr:hypothetical protein HF086_001652 [Spodoptera exigua]